MVATFEEFVCFIHLFRIAVLAFANFEVMDFDTCENGSMA